MERYLGNQPCILIIRSTWEHFLATDHSHCRLAGCFWGLCMTLSMMEKGVRLLHVVPIGGIKNKKKKKGKIKVN